MAQPIFIFCFLNLVLFVNGDPFDFFQLVQQWGPSTCNNTRGTQCYAQPQPLFTIHGLWPSNNSNARLACQINDQLKEFKVTALLSDLNTYWPDVISGNNFDFWQYEWKIHGACANPPFTVYQYFNIALELQKHKDYDLLAILNAAGLSPQISKNLVSQDILSPIGKKTGKKPGIHCNNNGKTGKLQLFEIVLCFDKNGANLLDCPPFVSSSCKSKFVWLPQQQSSVGVTDYP